RPPRGRPGQPAGHERLGRDTRRRGRRTPPPLPRTGGRRRRGGPHRARTRRGRVSAHGRRLAPGREGRRRPRPAGRTDLRRGGVKRVAAAAAAAGACALALAACSGASSTASSRPHGGAPAGIGKIRHVVVIMQENRSFDSYFGTFPGADGLPTSGGRFTTCVPDPKTHGCDGPYHDPADSNGGAGHGRAAALADIDGGKMDGFVAQSENSPRGCGLAQDPACAQGATSDVMGYHDAREIPNYWAYAQNFTLDDHMFEPVASWSLPAHLYMVSGWSALCTSSAPSSCRNQIVGPYGPLAQESYVDQA